MRRSLVPSSRSPCCSPSRRGRGVGDRGSRRRGQCRHHDHSRHPRLVRGLEVGHGRVHEADRHQGEDPPGRRRRRGAQPGDPHEVEPAGRRVLRRRQHVPQPGARPQGSSTGTKPSASTTCRANTNSTRRVGSRRSTTATCASTTTRTGSPVGSWRCPRRSTISPSPRTRGCSWSRTRRRRRPGWRSSSRPSRSSAPTVGRRYWKKLRSNDVKVDDGWESAYDGDFTQGANPGKYPLVVSYASSPPAAVYYAKPQPKTSPVGTMLDSCFSRWSSRACCTAPTIPRRRASSSTSCSRRSSSRTCPSRCSCSPS